MGSVAIWWIRRDLRMVDNRALSAALRRYESVVPLFVIDPRLTGRSELRESFLYDGLRSLSEDISARNGRLIVRTGNPGQVIPALARDLGAVDVFAEEDFTPFAKKRDALVGSTVKLNLSRGLSVHHPDALVRKTGEPYKTYSPFRKMWTSLPIESAVGMGHMDLNTPQNIETETIPTPRMICDWPAGQTAAMKRLCEFVEICSGSLWEYESERGRLDMTSSSLLSPYLRFGMLSASESVRRVQAIDFDTDSDLGRSASSWIDELIWRDFYQSSLYHRPELASQTIRGEMKNFPWRDERFELERWKTGMTGYPVVDASMRQLSQTGWINNRARMIVASFLTKHLLIDWRQGAEWFMRHLVDGDTASNAGGWQWVAGTGNDAAPFFRIFSPVLQGKKFDPDGRFVKKWLPELSAIPIEFAHEPWNWSLLPSTGYPNPVVDHRYARARALDAFKASRATRKQVTR